VCSSSDVKQNSRTTDVMVVRLLCFAVAVGVSCGCGSMVVYKLALFYVDVMSR